jgi:hypothetical protein
MNSPTKFLKVNRMNMAMILRLSNRGKKGPRRDQVLLLMRVATHENNNLAMTLGKGT